MTAVRTEADVAATLEGAVTLDELYAACERAGITDRDGGEDVIHGRTDTRWKRRARNALQAMKRSGRARHLGGATWLIEGTRERPQRALLILAGEPSDLTLVLGHAGRSSQGCQRCRLST